MPMGIPPITSPPPEGVGRQPKARRSRAAGTAASGTSPKACALEAHSENGIHPRRSQDCPVAVTSCRSDLFGGRSGKRGTGIWDTGLRGSIARNPPTGTKAQPACNGEVCEGTPVAGGFDIVGIPPAREPLSSRLVSRSSLRRRDTPRVGITGHHSPHRPFRRGRPPGFHCATTFTRPSEPRSRQEATA
jgi:hypothetical protein